MHDDPFKDRAPKEEDKAFRALFGCCCTVAYALWKLLIAHHLLPEGGAMTHLLWTLAFFKVYPTEGAMRRLCGGADSKTIRKWVDDFTMSISLLEPFVVSYDHSKILPCAVESIASNLVFIFHSICVCAHRSSGKIGRKVTSEMIVLLLLMARIFAFLILADDFIAINTTGLAYVMKLLSAF